MQLQNHGYLLISGVRHIGCYRLSHLRLKMYEKMTTDLSDSPTSRTEPVRSVGLPRWTKATPTSPLVREYASAAPIKYQITSEEGSLSRAAMDEATILEGSLSSMSIT